MKIKEAGFNYIANIWLSKMIWIPCRTNEKAMEKFSQLSAYQSKKK